MTWFRYDMNSQPFDVSWGTLGMGMTTDYESAKEFGMNTGEWLGEKWSNYDATPIDYRYPWELDMDSSYIRGGDQTVAQAMAAFQHVIDEAYPNKGYTIAPKRHRGSRQHDAGEPATAERLLRYSRGAAHERNPDDRRDQLLRRGQQFSCSLLLHSGNEPNRGSSRPLQRWFDVEHECLFDDVRHKRHRLLCECQHEPHPHRGAGGCAARAA